MKLKAAEANRAEAYYRLLLVLGSIVFAVCIVGLLARLEGFDFRDLVGTRTTDTDIADRELLHLHSPHSHISGSSRGGQSAQQFQIPRSERQLYQWDVHYDRNGFRNPSDLNQAGIAVIGDSFVEAITIPDAQLMTSLLAGMQSQIVANLGQFGYGPREEIVVLKRYGLPLRPRTVVWMFYEANDLGDVIHNRRAMREMDAAQTASPGPKASSIRQAISALHNRIRSKLRYAMRPSGVRRAGVVRTADGKRLMEYFDYPSPAFTPDNISALEETATIIETAEKLCAAQGARFVFVFIPTKFRAFQNSCEFPAQSECRNWRLNDLPERLRKAVGPLSAEVGYRDLTPDLVSAVKKGDFPYYSDDDHWSPAGNRIAAEAINRYLQEMSRQ